MSTTRLSLDPISKGRPMRTTKIVGLVWSLLFLSIGGVAQADTIFDVSGHFAIPTEIFAGTFSVDAAGNIVPGSIDIDVSGVPGGPFNFYNLFGVIPVGNTVTLQLTNGGSITELGFALTVGTPTGSFTGFTGGPIFNGFVAPLLGGTMFQLTCAVSCVASGAIGSVAVAGPATLVLLGFGMSGLLVARRRKLG